MNRIHVSVVLVAVFAVMASPSNAQDLLLHFPMESTDDGAGKLYSRDGGAVAVPGKVGNALSFDREALVALPFNLDHADYPQVTVTAWVKQEDGASGSRTIFHSGSTAGLTMAVNGGTLAMRTGGPGVSYSGGKIPNGEWVFVAAVLDTSAGIARLYQNDGAPTVKDGLNITTKEPRKFLDPGDPEAGKIPYVFVGGNDFKTFYGTARDLAIDDVRVFSGALSPDRIGRIRQGAGNTGRTVSQIPDGIANPDIGRPRNAPDLDPNKTPSNSPDIQQQGERSVGQIPDELENPDIGQLPSGAPDLDPDASSGDAQTAKAIGETEKNDAGEEESANLGKRPGRTFEQLPGDIKNPDIGAPSQAPELEPTDERSVGQIPDEIENPDVSRLPTGAPNPQYDSPEAAEEAARQREEAKAAAEEARDQQQGLEAAAAPHPTGEAKLSGLTGYMGNNIGTIDLQTEFLHHIGWWEKNNRPCRIELNSKKAAGCDLLYLSHKTVSLAKRIGVGSIEVCSTSNQNKRMKGIRISGDQINDDGTTTYWPNASAATRPNCSEWHQAVLCPNDTVATGLVYHYNTDGLAGAWEIVGLQLICRAVAVN